MREITHIVIHHSATPNGRSLFTGMWPEPLQVTPVEEVDRWHAERGFARKDGWRRRFNPKLSAIGYHFVVYMSGVAATGRHLDEVGAHCRGHNASSIGICLIGTGRFTHAAWDGLAKLVEILEKQYPGVEVVGHRDLAATECPGFDVRAWHAGGMVALADHLWPEAPPANIAPPWSSAATTAAGDNGGGAAASAASTPPSTEAS